MSFEKRPVAVAVLEDLTELDISEGIMTLDSGVAPYCLADLTVPLLPEVVLESLDPYANQRVVVTASAAEDGSDEREFDLVMTGRTVAHDGRSVALELASDEALLQRYADVTDDTGARTHEASLRAVVNYVLAEAITVRRNLAQNPWPVPASGTDDWQTRFGWSRAFSGDAVYFTCAGGSQPSVARGFDIRGNYDITPGTSGAWTSLPVKAGDRLHLSVSVGSTRPEIPVHAAVRLHDGAGNWLGVQVAGPAVSLASGWQQVSVAYTAPADGYIVGRVNYVAGYTLNDGDVMGARGLLIEPGTLTDDGYFDGGSYPPATHYDGVPNNSTSRWTAILEPGSLDADVTARWSLENAIKNPNGLNAVGYTNAGSCTVSVSSFAGVDGNNYPVGVSQAASGQIFMSLPQAVNTKKGDAWTLSAYMHADGVRTGCLRVYEMDDAGTVMRQIESTPKVLVAAGAAPYEWDRHYLPFTVQNPNTTKLTVYATMFVSAVGQSFGLDRAMLTPGFELPEFFSGYTVPSGYTTAWTGQTPTAHNSVSTRVPTDGIERLPELFTWEAGVTAWDFLTPIVNASGYRLWCDEQRRWWLTDPADYRLPGRVIAQASNTSKGTDKIDSSSGLYATGVVVVYTWTDAQDVQQRAVDSAGTGPYVVRVELDRPYPGPGAAAARLGKLQGQGRTQEVTVGADYSVTPAMEVGIFLPGTYAQIGTLQSVTWHLGDGLMDLTSRGLEDTPAGAINLLNGTIDALAGTIDALS